MSEPQQDLGIQIRAQVTLFHFNDHKTWSDRLSTPGGLASLLIMYYLFLLNDRSSSAPGHIHISATISDSAPLTILYQKHSQTKLEIRNPTRWIILLQPASRSSIWNIEQIF